MNTIINTSYVSDNEYTSTTTEGQQVKIDMKDEGKTDMSPMQLVLSALTGCVAVEVVSIIKKRRKTVADLKIKADGKRRDTAPKYYTDIHMTFTLVSPDANKEELDKAIKLSVEKYCSVGSSLKANITFEGVIERP